MCSASLAVQGAGLLIGSAGNIAQGEASYQSGLYSQRLYEQQASTRRQQGIVEKQRFLDDSSVKAGAQAAAYGVMGARMDEGSPADVMAKQMDAVTREAALIKWQAEVDAQQAMNQGAMARYQGSLSQYGSNVQATRSLLTGSTRLISSYLDKPDTTNEKNSGNGSGKPGFWDQITKKK